MKPSLELVFTLTSSVILTPTWYSSSFGPDLQILKVASSSWKVIFPQFSSLKNSHLTESHSPGVRQSLARTSGPIRSIMITCIVHLIYHKPQNAQSWKGWPPCAQVIFQKERAMWRRLDHPNSAQWKQTIINTGHWNSNY